MIGVPAETVPASLAFAVRSAGACALPLVPPDTSRRSGAAGRSSVTVRHTARRPDLASRSRGECMNHRNCFLHGCPCGYAGDPEKECTCSPTFISRYHAAQAPLRPAAGPHTGTARQRRCRRPGGRGAHTCTCGCAAAQVQVSSRPLGSAQPPRRGSPRRSSCGRPRRQE
jgi:hypothetical protein